MSVDRIIERGFERMFEELDEFSQRNSLNGEQILDEVRTYYPEVVDAYSDWIDEEWED